MTCLAFDIDGTIFDCGDIIVESFQRGIMLFNKERNKNIGIPGKDKIISVLGVPTDLIFQILFPGAGSEDQQRINDYCTNCLVDIINSGGGIIFEGVHETIERFHKEGYRIYAASNGRLQYIEAILKSNGLIDYFSRPIVVLNNMIRNKSGIVKHYKEFYCDNELLIMIGDRGSDRQAALDNDVPFIGCSFGHAGDNEIKGSQWITDNFKDIYKLVKNIEGNFVK